MPKDTKNNLKPVCPICLKAYEGYPATSRYDNKTLVCPNCGLVEAFNGMIIRMCLAAKQGFLSYAARMRTLGYQNPLALAIMEANKEYERLRKAGKFPPTQP